jgi:hypothetical protein
MVPRAKASLNESTGGVMAACMALRLLSTIGKCLLLITVRVALSVGRHGSGREAKPNPHLGWAMATHQSFYNRYMLTRNRHVLSVVAVGRHSQAQA